MNRRTSLVAWMAFAHDVVMSAVAFLLSLYLRLGDALFVYPIDLAKNLALMTVVAAVVFRAIGLYRGVWRYASLNDLVAIAKASSLVLLLYLPLAFLLTRASRRCPGRSW